MFLLDIYYTVNLNYNTLKYHIKTLNTLQNFNSKLYKNQNQNQNQNSNQNQNQR